jgi:hypothetical protein
MGSVACLLEQMLQHLLALQVEHQLEHVLRHLPECDLPRIDNRRAGPPRRGLP